MADDAFGSGVEAVFEAIASERKADSAKTVPAAPKRPRKEQSVAMKTAPPNDQGERPVARMGRYPGTKKGSPKEKITGRVAAELRDAYVNWSFEERCSLSDLIERALKEFYQRHGAADKSGK